jgi:hypothetical protein
MNTHPEPYVTVLVPVATDLHLLHAVLGQLQTSEVRVVVNDSDGVETAVSEGSSLQEPAAGGLRFSPIQGL